MQADSREAEETGPLSIEVLPHEVYAGARMTLRATVLPSPRVDLRGETVAVRDAEGKHVATLELTGFDMAGTHSDHVPIVAPEELGAYSWSAVLPESDDAETAHVEVTVPVAFEVRSHITDLVVWDVPEAIVRGEKFRMKAGLRCPAGCALAGAELTVADHDGNRVGRFAVGDKPWPETAALYATEIELEPPAEEGHYRWSFAIADFETGRPHAGDESGFGVRVVPPPEFKVVVTALERDGQAPVRGMKVVLHPYRAFTDENGVAELHVPGGRYTIYVSGVKYFPVRAEVEVTADFSTVAELDVDAPPDDSYFWA